MVRDTVLVGSYCFCRHLVSGTHRAGAGQGEADTCRGEVAWKMQHSVNHRVLFLLSPFARQEDYRKCYF